MDYAVADDRRILPTRYPLVVAEIDVPWVWLRLKHSLQALSMPADVQLGLFPDFVSKADELALDFDNFYQVVVTNDLVLTGKQRDTLARIDVRLDAMSDKEKSELWTPEGLKERTEWREIRELASNALSEFGWAVERPPSYAHEFAGLESAATEGDDSVIP
jgi:hypothetical protein